MIRRSVARPSHPLPLLGALLGVMFVLGPVTAQGMKSEAEAALAALDHCDVVWTTPSVDAAGSLPIGNGELGANVWVEPSGDLVLLLARTDAWSEACRLLKLGRVRISFSPSPLADDAAPLTTRLHLRDGVFEIVAGSAGQELRLSVFVDAEAPVLHVVGTSAVPRQVTATAEVWRTAPKTLTGEELRSSWTMHSAPAGMSIVESADLVGGGAERVRVAHRNETSVVPLTLAHQGLESARDAVKDPLLGRIFGYSITGPGFSKRAPLVLGTKEPTSTVALRIATESGFAVNEERFDAALRACDERSADASTARARTAASWNSFWTRSWIFVKEDAPGAAATGFARPPSPITRAYALQRWVQGAGGRGAYPIKFNGSIFTVEPKAANGQDFGPDWRRWGDCHWWQNLRLPYHAMLAAGDFEMMEPLFRLYEAARPLAEARARIYHGVSGAYFPETMSIFGTYSNGDYGWDRKGHEAKDVLCPWWQYVWVQGLELVALMLDRYDHRPDPGFLAERVVPMATAVLRYFDTRFARDEQGRLRITPTQALETHWHGVVNDLPTVAGLRAVTARLAALPKASLPDDLRALVERLAKAAPELPIRRIDEKPCLVAAEVFDPSRQNCETPELYATFPFRLATLGTPLRDAAREAYARRHDRATVGWTQDGHFAALLGLVDDAAKNLEARAKNSHPKYRWPATWGPNFDWLPDQCHGGNLLSLAQTMLLQSEGELLHVLPSWPKSWDVDFRLHAPKDTVIEGRYEGGKLVRLVVTPPERAADVRTTVPR